MCILQKIYSICIFYEIQCSGLLRWYRGKKVYLRGWIFITMWNINDIYNTLLNLFYLLGGLYPSIYLKIPKVNNLKTLIKLLRGRVWISEVCIIKDYCTFHFSCDGWLHWSFIWLCKTILFIYEAVLCLNCIWFKIFRL